MLSNRSKFLALVAFVALANSCQNTQRSLEVKAESDSGSAPAQFQAPAPSGEFEYFEGEAAPQEPAPRAERRPSAPSPAHVWVAGHYMRRSGDWAWVSGRYALPPHADDVWVPGHWVSHLNGFVWIDGAWR